MDASAIDAAVSAMLAAIGTYGQDVLGQVEGNAADATVSLGLRLLNRLRRTKVAGAGVEEAVTDVAKNPGDTDFETVLRARLKKAVNNDAELSADIEQLLGEGGISVAAYGGRSAAVVHNSGIISQGDNGDNRIRH